MKARTFAIGLTILGVAQGHRLAAQQPDGQAVYREECKQCHGLNGAPAAREREKYQKIKAFGDLGFGVALSVDSIVKILKKGIDKDMKSFAEKLDDGEMRAVAQYVKELGAKLQAKKP
jgi:mono/diheme cytochrome c family protein